MTTTDSYSSQEVRAIVNNAAGSYQYHTISMFPGYPVLTDSVKALCEAAGCYWLMDIIASHQCKSKVGAAMFQIWELAYVCKSKSDYWLVTMKEDSNMPVMVSQKLFYSDFPLPEGVKLYMINDGRNRVILLPGDY